MTKDSDTEISRYSLYWKYNNVFLTLLGWSNTHTSVIYRILPFIHLSINSSMAYFVFLFVRVHCTSILLITRGLTLMAGFSINILKMISLLKYKKEVFELREILEVHLIDLLKQNHYCQFLLNEMTRYRFLSWGLFISVLVCNIIFNSLPLSKIITNHMNHIQPDNYIFPYPTLFPWPVPFTGLIFQFHFFYEFVASVSVFIISVGVDSLFIFYIFLMVGQLREITYCITHIKDKSDSHVVIKKCIIQYCTIVKCCDHLQKIYGPIILCLMITNAVMLCTLTYQITQLKTLTLIKGVSFFFYIMVKIIQTYMYSWSGTHLTMESEEYMNAIYSANWYGDKHFMTAVVIMLQQKPLILTACNFSNVTIDIFTKILNTTISYYFLLKTLEEK